MPPRGPQHGPPCSSKPARPQLLLFRSRCPGRPRQQAPPASAPQSMQYAAPVAASPPRALAVSPAAGSSPSSPPPAAPAAALQSAPPAAATPPRATSPAGFSGSTLSPPGPLAVAVPVAAAVGAAAAPAAAALQPAAAAASALSTAAQAAADAAAPAARSVTGPASAPPLEPARQALPVLVGREGSFGKEHDCPAVGIESDAVAAQESSTRRSYTGVRHALEEFEHVEALGRIRRLGERLQQQLYTHRFISVTLPQPHKATGEEVAMQACRAACAALEPELRKLGELRGWMDNAHQVVHEAVGFCVRCDSKKQVASDVLLRAVAEVIDCCVVLDELKEKSRALAADWSHFKDMARRCGDVFAADGQRSWLSEQRQQIDEVFWCRAGTDGPLCGSPLTMRLRSRLRGVDRWTDPVADICNLAAATVEQGSYLLPTEKYQMVRVAALLLGWLEERSELRKAGKSHKRLDLRLVERVLDRWPYVPLMAEMVFSVQDYVRHAVHVDMQPEARAGKLAPLYLLRDAGAEREGGREGRLAHLREAFSQWASRWGFWSAATADFRDQDKLASDWARGDTRVEFERRADHLWANVLGGLQLLRDMTCAIWEQACFKGRKAGSGGTRGEAFYVSMVTGNYSREERCDLVEVIGMLRGVQRELCDAWPRIAPLLRVRVHTRLQHFVQRELRDLVRKTKKQGKKEAHQALLALRNCYGDWPPLGAQQQDRCLQGKKDDSQHPPPEVGWPCRYAGLTPTAVALLRATVGALVSERNPGMSSKGIGTVPDFNERRSQLLADFEANELRYWAYVLDAPATCAAAGDLSFLWMREWAREVGGVVSFPISASLPYALVEDIIDQPSAAHKPAEALLLPLTVYHDAGGLALRQWRSRTLFTEVEAELSLVWDEVVFKLAERVFTVWKCAAASELLDRDFSGYLDKKCAPRKRSRRGADSGADELRTAGTFGASLRWSVRQERLAELLELESVSLLGRTVDLRYQLSQRIADMLLSNLQHIVDRAEASGITSVCEVEQLLSVLRHTHHSLAAAGLRLDPWEDIVALANDDIAVLSFTTRLSVWIRDQLLRDVLPHWCYNTLTERFVKGYEAAHTVAPPKVEHKWLFGSRELTQLYEARCEVYLTYFGAEHIESILGLVPTHMLPFVIEELQWHLESLLHYDVQTAVSDLQVLDMAKQALGPLHGQSPRSTLDAYLSHQTVLRPLVETAQVKTKLFPLLCFLGNALAVFHLLDQAIELHDAFTSLAAAPFIGLGMATGGAAPPAVGELPAPTLERRPLPPLPAPSHHDELCVDPPPAAAAQYAPRVGSTGSVLRKALMRLRDTIQQNDIQRIISPDSAEAPAERTAQPGPPREFWVLYSALHFVFCTPPQTEEVATDIEYFGDGFVWAGCALLCILGQRRCFEAASAADAVLLCFSQVDEEGELAREQGKGPYAAAVDPKRAKKELQPQRAAACKEVLAFLSQVQHSRQLHRILLDLLCVALPQGDSLAAPRPALRPPTELDPALFAADPFAT
eukprot:TRINITY_DN9631_c0_g1_i2.p1 TRINITY_DN9631_c0_g1~~TRINITY_DN9631_c0_g1_i2.p1  ORF type:complete len:1514 (+),score=465.82 TRINITY_DN9631_c0_g1_i2:388-4929(+)